MKVSICMVCRPPRGSLALLEAQSALDLIIPLPGYSSCPFPCPTPAHFLFLYLFDVNALPFVASFGVLRPPLLFRCCCCCSQTLSPTFSPHLSFFPQSFSIISFALPICCCFGDILRWTRAFALVHIAKCRLAFLTLFCSIPLQILIW